MATLVFGDIMIIIGFTIDGDFAAEGAGVIIGLAPYLEAAVNRVELANLPFSDTALIIAALFQQNPNWTSSFCCLPINLNSLWDYSCSCDNAVMIKR